MSKYIAWALFDSETGDYTKAINKFFPDEVEVFGVGMSHYGKNSTHYLNFNLADFSELFTGESIGKRLLKNLPKPDIILASPPCESWSHMTGLNNGNIHWKRYASKLFPENKVFQLQDQDVESAYFGKPTLNRVYTRINGELCHQNTWAIIKEAKPRFFMVENPENYSWDYIQKYVPGGVPKMHLNKVVYSAYDPQKFSPKREIFASNIPLHLKQTFVQKNGNSIKSSCDTNGFIGKNYSTRSQIPELLIKDVIEKAIAYMEEQE